MITVDLPAQARDRDRTVPAETARFAADDGTSLHYRRWRRRGVSRGASRGAVIVLHRGHEHSGRVESLALRLAADGWDVLAPDMRGHGLSEGERGGGQSFAAHVADVDSFARHAAVRYGIRTADCAVVGVSIGAVVAAAWVHDFAPPIRALALVAPAFEVRLYVPMAIAALRLRQSLRPGGFVTSYVRPGMLTHDREQAQAFADDPLIFSRISVPMLLGLHDTGRRIVADAAAITCPTLVQSAGSDWVVKRGAQRKFLDNLGSAHKVWRDYPSQRHDLLHETQRERVISDIAEFLDRYAISETNGAAVDDQHGPMWDEHERLKRPLPWHSPRRWAFAANRLALQTGGRLSAGILLGWRAGFDSGQSLDYVYENRARGFTPLGRLIDRVYLNTIGWRGIRERRAQLHRALDAEIDRQIAAGQPIRVMDCAAGPGRYVLEALDRRRDADISAVLCDVRESELEQGRALAREMGLNRVRHERLDAFDPAAIAALRPQPSIAIVSGLYELFADNARVRASLAGLAEALGDNGSLIYTCQPWHPQMEFIARVLTNRESQPWVMRRRTQREMDALVSAAGFRKTRQWTGEDGLFTVSIARRTPSVTVADSHAGEKWGARLVPEPMNASAAR